MKTLIRLLATSALALALGVIAPATFAQIVVPSDGSDGSLLVITSTNIDLSQATTGVWSQNNSTNAGNGVYDPVQWAVVFKYTNVIIQAGATVTFINHPSRAPVVWLVSGNVDIEGTISLDGWAQAGAPFLAEPGPGGFRGGVGNIGGGAGPATGFGPGTWFINDNDWGANYGTTTSGNAPAPYGNPSLIPLIGGSGGSGDNNKFPSLSGGGGGGAMLIAVANDLTLNGTIHANGGGANGIGNQDWHNSPGSGGGIRLVANTLLGDGVLIDLCII